MTFVRDVKHVEMWIDLGAFGVGRMVFGRPQRGPLCRRVVVSRQSGCLDGWWGTIRDIYSEDREGNKIRCIDHH